MRIFNTGTIEQWILNYPDARQALATFKRVARSAKWASFLGLKSDFPSADSVTVKGLADTRVIFDICNNKYRMICHVNFAHSAIFLKGSYTHKEYDNLRLENLTF